MIARNYISLLHTAILLLSGSLLSGQVVRIEPVFANQFSTITVFFDASEGNGALAGFDGEVYTHTGLITSQSTSSTDWKYVVGNWGTADTRTQMTKIGDDLYSLSYTINTYYGIPDTEEALRLAFVFRNESGSIVGRDRDGSDIFLDLFSVDGSLQIQIAQPQPNAIYCLGDSVPFQIDLSDTAHLVVIDQGDTLVQDTLIQWIDQILPTELGTHKVEVIASHQDTIRIDTLSYLYIDKTVLIKDPPMALQNGANLTDSSVIFQLTAPGKTVAFFLTAVNQFRPHPDFRMFQDSLLERFWIELPMGLFQNGQNVYQYQLDDNLIIADPYSELILDPNNDPFVDPMLMAELPNYPAQTRGMVTVLPIDSVEFEWQVESFQKPMVASLVVYELLMRDFLEDHSYQSLLDTLSYLKRLGVNAIELMPVNEFEGNQSWGYNPSFHMALDKYYGSRDDFKRFVDAAHELGIAVILDVVYNHVFSQSPLAQMYWDPANNRPSADNPWLNVTARHPFNVGYDVNHESAFSREWVKQVVQYWIEEYKIDGFRFDLSKGFTQTNSGQDNGLMSQYDASRIAILKDYAGHIWSIDSTNYVILEHFADVTEERELADNGMLLWGNMNHDFIESAKGNRTNLAWADYGERGFSKPGLITYLESHDEERMIYRVLREGEREGAYSTRNLATALQRAAAANVLMYSLPGPKMLWQFGELGYDFSINRCVDGRVDGCRLDPKPVRWDYLADPDRAQLFQIMSNLFQLRTQYPTFSTEDYAFDDANLFIKKVTLRHDSMDAFTIVNFRVTSSMITPGFPYTGVWYEYFSGDSIIVNDLSERMELAPGDYRLYTSQRITPPNGVISNTIRLAPIRVVSFPNPNPSSVAQMYLPGNDPIQMMRIWGVNGQIIDPRFQQMGNHLRIHLPANLAPGMYTLSVMGKKQYLSKILVTR